MDVSVRELRNHTARVIAAIEAGEPVVLTKHGRAVADILPRTTRVHSMPTDVFMAHLAELRETWRELGVDSDPSAYELSDVLDDDFEESYGARP